MSHTLHARVLHTDGTITEQICSVEDDKLTDAAVTAGTRLRAADPTVAAVKFAELGDQYVWEGHATTEHLAAARDARMAGRW